MREILFRGKCITTKEWVYGSFYIGQVDQRAFIVDPLNTYEVDPETVGQYIGQKDIEGKNVFEGDIYAKRDYFNRLIFLEIGYDCASFCYRLIGNTDCWTPIDDNEYPLNFDHCTCVGNIHDNPIRVKKKEEPYET